MVFSDNRAAGSLPLEWPLIGHFAAKSPSQPASRVVSLRLLTQAQHGEALDSFEPSDPCYHNYNTVDKMRLPRD